MTPVRPGKCVFPVIILTTILSFRSGEQHPNPLTREDATTLILNEIIVPATLRTDLTAFLTMVPLPSGTVVEPFLNGQPIQVTSPSWFAWLNDDPQALFGHPTRFVLIDISTRQISIHSSEWWPMVNNAPMFMSDSEWGDMELIIYSDLHRVK